jgi:CobQ-like glutamine amidotransferase family enzyme
MLTVLSVLPQLLGLNGDSNNAAVLAQRANWSGADAEVFEWNLNDTVPPVEPGIVVVGSATEPDLGIVLAELWRLEPQLRRWGGAGVPILAVGTGWELLTESVSLADGSSLTGLGLFPGRSVPGVGRTTGDLVVTSEFGILVGFESHERDLLLAPGAIPLGTVVSGRGNGAQGGITAEGMLLGPHIGTHLRGPVLAKNPVLADRMLASALGARYKPETPRLAMIDALAAGARSAVLAELKLSE